MSEDNISRRKILAASGAATTSALTSYKIKKSDNHTVYRDEDFLCYQTAYENLEGQEVSFYFEHKDRDDEFRLTKSILEPSSDGLEACTKLDNINIEEYDVLVGIEVDDERVWEGLYSVS